MSSPDQKGFLDYHPIDSLGERQITSSGKKKSTPRFNNLFQVIDRNALSSCTYQKTTESDETQKGNQLRLKDTDFK